MRRKPTKKQKEEFKRIRRLVSIFRNLDRQEHLDELILSKLNSIEKEIEDLIRWIENRGVV